MVVMTHEAAVFPQCHNHSVVEASASLQDTDPTDIIFGCCLLLLFHWNLFRFQHIHNFCEILRMCALWEPHGSFPIKATGTILPTLRAWWSKWRKMSSLPWPTCHWIQIKRGSVNVDSCTPFLHLNLFSFCEAPVFQDANPLVSIPLQTPICACRTSKKTWSVSIGHKENCVFLVVAPPSEASLLKVCRAFKVWVLVDKS